MLRFVIFACNYILCCTCEDTGAHTVKRIIYGMYTIDYIAHNIINKHITTPI